jgi:hypothetical protein
MKDVYMVELCYPRPICSGYRCAPACKKANPGGGGHTAGSNSNLSTSENSNLYLKGL